MAIVQCDKCENTAVYARRYSGEGLCKDCFTDSIMAKTARTISKYKMIRYGDLVAVAVSGGKDSLALLHVLNQMSKMHDFGIHAITIDEGIPGYRDEALGIVNNYCRELQVKCSVLSYKELFDLTLEDALEERGDENVSSCSICGTLRRRAMDHAAEGIGADVLATAHNLDDVLQTHLINMLSGNVGRIGWTRPDARDTSLRKVKPFSEIYESEIVFYAFSNKIPFQTEPCPHTNEGIRTEIREFLNSLEQRHAGIKNNLYNSVTRVSEIVRSVDDRTGGRCANCGARCTGKTCSVCGIISKFRGNGPNANITRRRSITGSR